MSYRFATREFDKCDIFCQLTRDFTRGTKHELIDSWQISIRAGWRLGGPRVAQGWPKGLMELKPLFPVAPLRNKGGGTPCSMGLPGFYKAEERKQEDKP